MEPDEAAVTRLLSDYAGGKKEAAEQLMPLIYSELHNIAVALMRRERSDHTWQPTLLVHDAFLRMIGNHASWRSRKHFLAVAATAMRRLLVDHARAAKADKRGGKNVHVDLLEGIKVPETGNNVSVDMEALDTALGRLASIDERAARVVELRFFGGLDVRETADIIGVSPATVKRDWQFARLWLQRETDRTNRA